MPGAWLQQVRIKLAIPIEQVAKELNLDIRKVEALEASRFAEFGAAVYAKGYLRRYARLLNVPETALLDRYESYGGAPKEVDPIPVSMGSIPERRPVLPRWVRWLVLAFIGLAAAASLWSMRSTPVPDAAMAVQSLPLVNTPTIAQLSPLESLPSNTVPIAGHVSLDLKFKADSWAEVYDANRQQLLYEMGTAGQSRRASGLAPLSVKLGSATAVELQINAQPTIVPATHIDVNVARFLVNASGTIE
jgi:cytoskeleton protein RodZ